MPAIDILAGVMASKKLASTTRHKWTAEEDAKLRQLVEKSGGRKWKAISACMENRSAAQCRQRWGGLQNPYRHKRAWTAEENLLLARLVEKWGAGKWGKIAEDIGTRNPKQCRERWHNQLSPVVKKKN